MRSQLILRAETSRTALRDKYLAAALDEDVEDPDSLIREPKKRFNPDNLTGARKEAFEAGEERLRSEIIGERLYGIVHKPQPVPYEEIARFMRSNRSLMPRRTRKIRRIVY